jgi:hypothetical protein
LQTARQSDDGDSDKTISLMLDACMFSHPLWNNRGSTEDGIMLILRVSRVVQHEAILKHIGRAEMDCQTPYPDGSLAVGVGRLALKASPLFSSGTLNTHVGEAESCGCGGTDTCVFCPKHGFCVCYSPLSPGLPSGDKHMLRSLRRSTVSSRMLP